MEKQYHVLKSITLKAFHKKIGFTNHYKGECAIESPHSLQIIQYPGEKFFYLIHLSKDNEEITDTFHERIEDAMEQARLEFGIGFEEWNNYDGK